MPGPPCRGSRFRRFRFDGTGAGGQPAVLQAQDPPAEMAGEGDALRVAIRTVVPSRFMLWKMRASSSAVASSILPVGSSAIKSSGRPTMARAIATSCRSPPDSVEAGASIRFSRPSQASNSGTFLPISRSRRSGDAQRQRDIVGDAPILDDTEVLKHDSDAAAQRRPRGPVEPARIRCRTASAGRRWAARRARQSSAASSCRRRRPPVST